MTQPHTGRDAALDNPVWWALTGADRHLAQGGPRARRYRADVSPFAAVADDSPAAWAELAELATEPLAVIVEDVPDGWVQLRELPVVQMVYTATQDGPPAGGHEFSPLGPADVPEMLALAEETKPGPFAPHTIDLGGYRGWRADGRLACMAGERMHPGDWTEISAVCTAPAYQGRGLAGSIVNALVSDILAAGRSPFLHVMDDNAGARRLYGKLGFGVRARTVVRVLRPATSR